MPLRRLIESTNHAIEGILQAAKAQRHLRYHFYAAVAVLILSYIIGVNREEFIAVTITVTLVLMAEMLNTAVEATVDLLSSEYHIKAKAAKDIAAGAVLVSASGAVIVGYIIFIPYLRRFFYEGITMAKHSNEDISIIALIIVIIAVIITKAFFGRGLPLRGGMPSGHAAVAFSVWIAVTYITEAFFPSFLVFILAILIAQSRVAIGAHSPWEVFLGALLGITITFLLFRLFS